MNEDDAAVEVVKAYFAAAHQNEAALLATIADDGFIDVPPSLPYGGLHRGHDGFRRALAGFATAWRDVTSLELTYGVVGDRVVTLSRMMMHRARHAGARFSFVNVALWESEALYRAAFAQSPVPKGGVHPEAYPALYDVAVQVKAGNDGFS